LGMGFTALALLAAAAYLRRPNLPRYAACLVALWGALNSHLVLGALAVFAVGLVMVLVPDGDGRARWWRLALVVPPGLLSAYYYLPLVLFSESSTQLAAVYP